MTVPTIKSPFQVPVQPLKLRQAGQLALAKFHDDGRYYSAPRRNDVARSRYDVFLGDHIAMPQRIMA